MFYLETLVNDQELYHGSILRTCFPFSWISNAAFFFIKSTFPAVTLLFFFVPLAPNDAIARQIQVPLDPIAPRSMRECDDLYAQYQAVLEEVRLAAKAKGDEAWEIAKSRGPNAAAPVYNAARQLREEAIQVVSEGSRARNRCAAQVYAYQQAQSRREAEEQQRIRISRPDADHARPLGPTSAIRQAKAGLPVDAGLGTLRTSVLSGLEMYQNYGGVRIVGGEAQRGSPSPHRAALARTILKIVELYDLFSPLQNRGGAGNLFGRSQQGAEVGQGAIGSLVGWNSVQKMFISVSLGMLFDLHGSAVQDLQNAMAAFDGEIDGLGPKFESAKSNETALLSGQGFESSAGAHLAEIYQEARQAVASLVAARANAARSALRQAAQERAAARAREIAQSRVAVKPHSKNVDISPRTERNPAPQPQHSGDNYCMKHLKDCLKVLKQPLPAYLYQYNLNACNQNYRQCIDYYGNRP